MYQKIMVPLDGSKLAECVLPNVEAIARGCGSNSVVFVRIVDSARLPSTEDRLFGEEERQRIESDMISTARDYFDQLVARIEWGGVNIQSEVIVGKVTESLTDYAEKNGVDLIVMATHGRSGISRWAWGSAADRILRSARVPVLMVRAPGCISGI